MIWAQQGVRVTSAKPLVLAARGHHLEVLQCLVHELGAEVNQTNNEETALMIAAAHGFAELVWSLVRDLGADIDQGMNGVTPLHIAASRGQLVVRYLVELGVEVGGINTNGDTALLTSALFGHYSTLQYLLEEAGANMCDINNSGRTVWDLLIVHLRERTADDADDVEVKAAGN
jgi:ankyrin repeat protein